MAADAFPCVSLPELPAGWSLDFNAAVTSTNDLALSCLTERGALAHGACFVASAQTSGRGRLGRPWSSQPGDGLYFSAVLCPKRPRSNWPSLSFAASLAVCNMLAGAMAGQEQRLSVKWPNDVLADDGKIAGILLEAAQDGVIVGCGVNLKQAPKTESQKHTAVALDEFVSAALNDPAQLAVALVHRLEQSYQHWSEQGPRSTIALWQKKCRMRGRQVVVTTLAGEKIGICDGFGADGQLLLHSQRGIEEISAGDVEIMKG